MRNLANTLASGVASVFGRLGIPTQEFLTGPLVFTDLDWQVPPLRSEAPLNKVPFWQYTELPIKVDEEAFCSFWSDTLYTMRHQPSKVWLHGAYRDLGKITDLSKPSQAYCFSYPDGAPDQATDYAGVIFSLECVNVLQMSGIEHELFKSEDDYYVKTAKGYEVGVMAGLPIAAAEEWDLSARGVVTELLYQSRGTIDTTCNYDIIDKMRSALWENRQNVKEFEGADLALQALRVLEGSAQLLRCVKALDNNRSRSTSRLMLLRSAMKTVGDKGLSDRQKIQTLKETLVPSAMSRSKFSKLLYEYSSDLPPMLSLPRMLQLVGNLAEITRIEEDSYANKI